MINLFKCKTLYYALPLFLLATACGKEFLDTKPNNSITTDNFYQSSADAISATNAAYNPIQGLYNGSAWQILDIMSDDADKGGGGANDGVEVYQLDNFTLDAFNPMVANYWGSCYQGIYRANLGIAKIPSIPLKATAEDTAIVKRSIGECYFLRGYYHYMLVRLFGDVPLINTPLSLQDTYSIPRSSKADVYASIVQDLKTAATYLPATRYSGDNAGRVNALTAKGMLSSVYLTMGNNTDAAATAIEVINAGVYRLNTNYADNFDLTKENGVESMFEVQYRNGGQQWQYYGQGSVLNCFLGPRGQKVVASDGYGFDVPTPEFVANYTRNAAGQITDKRVNRTIWKPGDTDGSYTQPAKLEGSDNGYNVKKYYVPAANSASDPGGWACAMNVPVLRYAEVLLIAAEASGPGVGDQYVNLVRKRAGLSDLPTGLSNQDYIDAIFKERRLEMAFEMHRWFDLIRYPLDNTYFIKTMNAQGHPASEKHRYMPIPQAEIDKNPSLTQNPLY